MLTSCPVSLCEISNLEVLPQDKKTDNSSYFSHLHLSVSLICDLLRYQFLVRVHWKGNWHQNLKLPAAIYQHKKLFSQVFCKLPEKMKHKTVVLANTRALVIRVLVLAWNRNFFYLLKWHLMSTDPYLFLGGRNFSLEY